MRYASLRAIVGTGAATTSHNKLVHETLRAVGRGCVDLSGAASVVPAVTPTRPGDKVFDGALLGALGIFSNIAKLSDVAPVLPDNGATVATHAILLNGIMTDIEVHQGDMQALANSGCAVVGIHNSTNGMVVDLAEALASKLGVSDPPAVHTLVRLLALSLDEGWSIRVIGHSQGALLVARALMHVKKALETDMTTAQAEALLGRVSVETYGGAAQRYVDGPRYRHVFNRLDLIPLATGVGLGALNPFERRGRGAVVDSFVAVDMPRFITGFQEEGTFLWKVARAGEAPHGARNIYFSRRTFPEGPRRERILSLRGPLRGIPRRGPRREEISDAPTHQGPIT
jgi:hypothetical protein